MWEQKKIKVPLFPCVLYIILTNDLERVKKEFPDCYFDEVYATSVWGKTDEDNNFYCILNPAHREGLNYGVIAHESVHLANFTMRRCGVKADLENDETQAYLVSFFTNEIGKFLDLNSPNAHK